MHRHFQKKSGRQTDKHNFSKRHFELLFTPQNTFSTIQRHKKCFKNPLKQFCDGRTDGPTDKPTDQRTDQKVAYRDA